MTTPREAAVDWATHALVEVLLKPAAQMKTRAESFVAIADEEGFEIEELIEWIYEKCAGKDWTIAEWRAYCQLLKRRRAAAQLAEGKNDETQDRLA